MTEITCSLVAHWLDKTTGPDFGLTTDPNDISPLVYRRPTDGAGASGLEVITIRDGLTRRLKITSLVVGKWVPFVRPIGPDRFLVLGEDPRNVSVREHARVITADGQELNRFRIGRNVSCVETTIDATFWIGYDDEGTFSTDYLSNAGLACFASDGGSLFRYNDVHESLSLPRIMDCVAINASQDQVVVLAGNDVLSLRGTAIATHSRLPRVELPGVIMAVAFSESAMLIADSRFHYTETGGTRRFRLFSGSARGDAVEVTPVLDGQPVEWSQAAARGSRMFIANGSSVYSIDMGQT